MPGEIAGTREILNWIAQELGPDTYVNVMAQYYPAGKVSDKEHIEINRSITLGEFRQALDFGARSCVETTILRERIPTFRAWYFGYSDSIFSE